MSNKNNSLDAGLRFLKTEAGDLIDMETNPQQFEDLIADGRLSQSKSNLKNDRTVVKTPIITATGKIVPNEYLGRDFDDLYRSDELETVRKRYPDLYEKLRDEKYPHLKQK